jgi:hypothetical protein
MDRYKYSTISRAIWLFALILIFESACRKWIFPSANYLFLIIRDPIVIWVVVQGIMLKLLKDTLPLLMMCLGCIAFITTMMFGHHNIVVALYGLRISLLYFPFIYICSKVISRSQILLIGKLLIILLIPIVSLTVIQFLSPQSDWVNRGVGGDIEGAGFAGGALGYYRPPGIFSQISGLTDYYGITFGFLLYFWVDKKAAIQVKLSRTILFFATVAYLISIPVSISRTHFFQTSYILFFSSIVWLRKPAMFKKIGMILSLIIIGGIILYSQQDSNIFVGAFLTRFNGANETSGGAFNDMTNRSFGWALRALNSDVPFWGYGDGHFTNVGMMLMKGGTGTEYFSRDIAKVVDATEMEWGRILCESGILLGSLIILTRWLMAVQIFREIWKKTKINDSLGWFLAPFAIYVLIILQIKSSYHLGFMALGCILALGACRTEKHKLNNNLK